MIMNGLRCCPKKHSRWFKRFGYNFQIDFFVPFDFISINAYCLPFSGYGQIERFYGSKHDRFNLGLFLPYYFAPIWCPSRRVFHHRSPSLILYTLYSSLLSFHLPIIIAKRFLIYQEFRVQSPECLKLWPFIRNGGKSFPGLGIFYSHIHGRSLAYRRGH